VPGGGIPLQQRSRQSGFTLVEIAVVLVIVGLVFGAAVKGYAIYRNTQLQAVFSKMKEYEAAAVKFKTSYKFWPGDFRYATTNLVGCTAGSTNIGSIIGWPFNDDCGDGNGDQLITGPYTYIGTYIADPGFENLTFFRHMAIADLLDRGLLANGGTAVPTTEIGGIIFARTLLASGFSQPGLHLIIGQTIDGTFAPVLTPREARYIDGKFDDGKPGFGRLKFRGSVGVDNDSADDDCTDNNQQYKTTVAKSCMMGMYIDQ
jgi:prepilin-type N-terminal cleavage/methylation domain-containing protein